MMGRPRVTAIRACPACAASPGGACTSSFRLPVTTTLRAPSTLKRSASVSDCARQVSKRPSKAPMVAENFCQRGNERCDIRALISTIGSRRLRGRDDQVGPEVALDEQRQARLPVIEKARHEARRIVGNVLMDDIGRETLGDDLGRGHRARGQAGCAYPARAAARSALPPPALRRRWRRESRPAAPAGRSICAMPRRSSRRAGSSLFFFSRCLIRTGASGVSAADSLR